MLADSVLQVIALTPGKSYAPPLAVGAAISVGGAILLAIAGRAGKAGGAG